MNLTNPELDGLDRTYSKAFGDYQPRLPTMYYLTHFHEK